MSTAWLTTFFFFLVQKVFLLTACYPFWIMVHGAVCSIVCTFLLSGIVHYFSSGVSFGVLTTIHHLQLFICLSEALKFLLYGSVVLIPITNSSVYSKLCAQSKSSVDRIYMSCLGCYSYSHVCLFMAHVGCLALFNVFMWLFCNFLSAALNHYVVLAHHLLFYLFS